METRRNLVQICLLGAMMAINLSAVSGATSLAPDASAKPAKSAEAIPWSQIGAKAGADYNGDGLAVSAAAGQTQQLTSPDQVPQGLAKSDWASIRAAYEAGRHAFQPVAGQDGVWQARNPGQQWLTRFDGRGFLAEPKGGGWRWGLALKSYGFPSAERVINGAPAVKAEGQRLTYGWDAAVSEWFVNDPRGLEHGFTVQERPAQDASLNSQPSAVLHRSTGQLSTLCLRCAARWRRRWRRMARACSSAMPPERPCSTTPG